MVTEAFSSDRSVQSLEEVIRVNVRDALAEDIGGGDLTAALIDPDEVAGAKIVARQSLVLAGYPWATEVFRQLDETILVDWYIEDGERAAADDVICKLVGPARPLLSGERTALNFPADPLGNRDNDREIHRGDRRHGYSPARHSQNGPWTPPRTEICCALRGWWES